MLRLVLGVAAAAVAASTLAAPAHADPVKCKDVGSFVAHNHVCLNSDGSATSCTVAGPVPQIVLGAPCQTFTPDQVRQQEPPSFWNDAVQP